MYHSTRWFVKVLSVAPGTGRGRRACVPTLTVSWPGIHDNKPYIDWYPELYDEVQNEIKMALFFEDVLQVMQLVAAPPPEEQITPPAPATALQITAPAPPPGLASTSPPAPSRACPSTSPPRQRLARQQRRIRPRPPLPPEQYECEICHLRADSEQAVEQSHDRHFPWCSRYTLETSLEGSSFFIGVAVEECGSEVVATLKNWLLLYGESTSGKKHELLDRIRPLMHRPAPFLGVGSWFHFQKQQTEAVLKQFCNDNHIMIPSKCVFDNLYPDTPLIHPNPIHPLFVGQAN